MSSSHGPRADRAFLRVEALEERVTPSTRVSAPIPVPITTVAGQVAAGQVAGDRVTVVLNPGVSSAVLAAPFTSKVKSLGDGSTFSVIFTAGTNLDGALAYYRQLPGVAVAATDKIVYPERVPNDAQYAAQYAPARIGAEAVWNRTTGNPAFVVGVSDGGVDYTHPDIAPNIWVNPGEIAGNGVDDDRNGYVDDVHGYDFENDDSDPMDEDGHGTHVSGIIGAAGNNAFGTTGVNWNVKIMALRWIGSSGLISNAVAALNYALNMGVKVTNNSWGSNGGGPDPIIGRAIARAQSLGHIFVCSAGNIGADNDANPLRTPSNLSTSYDNVVATAATDNNDQLGSFSNYGATTVTLGAPGVGIVSTVPYAYDADGVVDGFESYDGTSMASPQVAGAIALYWGANPTLTYQQVINKLKSSVDKVAGLTGLVSTGGRLNVAKMFDAITVPPVVVNAPVGTSVVRVLAPGGATAQTLIPHPGFLGGIVAAAGDVTGDGVADTVTAATFGGHVKVFDGLTGAEIRSFYAFFGYRGPISLAIGDLTGDGVGDLIVSANRNGHVRVFDGVTGQIVISTLMYNGYSGSVAVSAADVDGDGRNELVTGADAAAGVHVKVFQPGALNLRDSFFVAGRNQWPDFSLMAADLDYDGVAELMVSQGPRVRVLDARTKAVRADFLAFDPKTTDRITVQAGQYRGDPPAELVVIDETRGRSQVKVFDGLNFTLADSFVAGSR